MSPAMTNAVITLTTEVESVMGTLCDLLDRETDAVHKSDFDTFREVQGDKFAILNRYRALMDTLQRQAPSLAGADEPLKKRLKALHDKSRASIERNTEALEAGRNSMQRILDRIVRCARETVHANRQTYNKAGVAGTRTQIPVSIQIDEVL